MKVISLVAMPAAKLADACMSIAGCLYVMWVQHCVDNALVLTAAGDSSPRHFANLIKPADRQRSHWDFHTATERPVKLFMHVREDTDPPVRVVLMVGAALPRVTSANVILPTDPKQEDVDLDVDYARDLSFPANSLIGLGAYGQVGVVSLNLAPSVEVMCLHVGSFANAVMVAHAHRMMQQAMLGCVLCVLQCSRCNMQWACLL